MAMTVADIQEWLATLDPEDGVGIGDEGLSLTVVGDPETYLEIGGIPESGDWEEEALDAEEGIDYGESAFS